jgi:hypothetical protein
MIIFREHAGLGPASWARKAFGSEHERRKNQGQTSKVRKDWGWEPIGPCGDVSGFRSTAVGVFVVTAVKKRVGVSNFQPLRRLVWVRCINDGGQICAARLPACVYWVSRRNTKRKKTPLHPILVTIILSVGGLWLSVGSAPATYTRGFPETSQFET